MTSTDVLEFWFSDHAKKMWWNKSDAFDEEIRTKFGTLVEEALAGEHAQWANDQDGALALVIVLDQFTRNLFRGSARSFAGDARAKAVATAAVLQRFDEQLSLERRMFLYMPFQHSEDLADQDRAIELFTRWAADHGDANAEEVANDLKYAKRHREIIERFGRFPHRNAVLGRESTPEELAFLKEPMSSF